MLEGLVFHFQNENNHLPTYTNFACKLNGKKSIFTPHMRAFAYPINIEIERERERTTKITGIKNYQKYISNICPLKYPIIITWWDCNLRKKNSFRQFVHVFVTLFAIFCSLLLLLAWVIKNWCILLLLLFIYMLVGIKKPFYSYHRIFFNAWNLLIPTTVTLFYVLHQYTICPIPPTVCLCGIKSKRYYVS